MANSGGQQQQQWKRTKKGYKAIISKKLLSAVLINVLNLTSDQMIMSIPSVRAETLLEDSEACPPMKKIKEPAHSPGNEMTFSTPDMCLVWRFNK